MCCSVLQVYTTCRLRQRSSAARAACSLPLCAAVSTRPRVVWASAGAMQSWCCYNECRAQIYPSSRFAAAAAGQSLPRLHIASVLQAASARDLFGHSETLRGGPCTTTSRETTSALNMLSMRCGGADLNVRCSVRDKPRRWPPRWRSRALLPLLRGQRQPTRSGRWQNLH